LSGFHFWLRSRQDEKEKRDAKVLGAMRRSHCARCRSRFGSRLAVSAGVPVTRLPPALPQWAGCYVGGNVGGAWAKIDESGNAGGTVSAHPTGVAGGGQIGCDMQFAEWVFGIRDMFDGTNLRSSTNFATGSAR
jgi:hypothetical protein